MENIDKELAKNRIEELKKAVSDLKNEMIDPEELFPNIGTLPGLDMEMDIYDYEKDIQLVKEEAEETIACISSLYLNESIMTNRNINKLIKNDAEEISDIKFSLSCAKRGLINCMKQLDAGSNDPEMHNAVNAYQKEIRESNKMLHDLLNKMKDFYKDLRNELKTDDEINIGRELEIDDLKIIDKSEFNKLIDQFKDDPTLIKK